MVRIRLRRVGSNKNPIWRIVVGQYNPQTEPSLIEIDEDRAKHWLEKGARPTRQVATLLRTKGIEAAGS